MSIDDIIARLIAIKNSGVDGDNLVYFADDHDIIDTIDTIRVDDDGKVVVRLWN